MPAIGRFAFNLLFCKGLRRLAEPSGALHLERGGPGSGRNHDGSLRTPEYGPRNSQTWRYSRQIMAHLIAEGQRVAREWTGAPQKKPQWLVLREHHENARAIRFYQACGFELIPDALRKDHLPMKLWVGD